jgi:hypothetical protein
MQRWLKAGGNRRSSAAGPSTWTGTAPNERFSLPQMEEAAEAKG